MIGSEWPNFKVVLRQAHCDISGNFLPPSPPKPKVFNANFKPVIKFRTFDVPRGFIAVFTTTLIDLNLNEINPVHASYPYYL